MEPQNLMDAFRRGYRVFIKNRTETIDLLNECHRLGIRWATGIDALRLIPEDNNICFCYDGNTGRITYGWLHGICPEISWASLLSAPQVPESLFSY